MRSERIGCTHRISAVWVYNAPWLANVWDQRGCVVMYEVASRHDDASDDSMGIVPADEECAEEESPRVVDACVD